MRITTKHPVRAELSNLPNYFDSKGDALCAVSEILSRYNLRSDCAGLPGGESYGTYPLRQDVVGATCCAECGARMADDEFENCIVLSHYTMPSGRIELTVYIS